MATAWPAGLGPWRGRRASAGGGFIYALLSKNAVNRGFLRFSKVYEVLPSPCDKKAVINFLL